MKTNHFKSTILATTAIVLLSLTACQKQQFHIEGTIAQAEDSVLYLENMSLNGPVAIDSVKLKANGAFSFAGKKTDAPEFYRLRIAGQTVNLAVDSTETISVKATWPNLSAGYEVEGSDNCQKIKELALKQMQLQQTVNNIAADPTLGVKAVQDSVLKVLDVYKNEVKNQYIFPAPNKAYAYYALFQSFQLGYLQSLIFNPRNSEDDVKVFAAVATSWDTYYPKAERGENLHNIAIEGMKNVRIIRSQQAEAIEVQDVQGINIIDLQLLDNKGQLRKLTDQKGKVILLDFHAFAAENSLQRIMALRELYNKYHDQGFDIYQVSEDDNIHFWKTQTAALPWISVHDQDFQAARAYNVLSLPTYFLIDRSNTLRKRDAQIQNLEAEIKALL